MQSRLAATTVAVLFLASAAFAAYFAVPRTELSRSPTDVDHVALYQNGLAAITLVRPFEGRGGDQVLTLSLPTTTVFDSLAVEGEGVRVKEMRSSLAADPALRPGDSLVVHLGDGERLAGTFQAQDGQAILLSRDGGTAVVRLEHVRAVEVTGRTVAPTGPGSTSVEILVEAQPGPRVVRVSYLAQGVGWQPNHILDTKTGAFTFFATLTGMQDWSNVTLDLVAGRPNTVYTPRYGEPQSFAFAGAAAGADMDGSGGGFAASESLGALHRYRYRGTVDLEQGQTVRLPVDAGRLDVVRHYFRADGAPHRAGWQGLPETYQLRNTLGEPIPAGPVRAYTDGHWVGADSMPPLGKLESGNVTVAFTEDVKTRTVQVEQSRSQPVNVFGTDRRFVRVTTTYEFQVRNLGEEEVDVRAAFETGEGGTTRLVDAKPAPDHREGSRLVWDSDLGAGDTVTYRITIQSEETVYT